MLFHTSSLDIHMTTPSDPGSDNSSWSTCEKWPRDVCGSDVLSLLGDASMVDISSLLYFQEQPPKLKLACRRKCRWRAHASIDETAQGAVKYSTSMPPCGY